MRKHLASCGHVGNWGRRHGTSYAYTPRSAWGIRGEPWFRFRNDECERICREAWQQGPPKGLFFRIAAITPQLAGRDTTNTFPQALLECPLVAWEREGLTLNRTASQLYHYVDTDLFQWWVKSNHAYWYPKGEVLRLNTRGSAISGIPLTGPVEDI